MKRLISRYRMKRGFQRTQAAIRTLDEQRLNAAETIDFVFSKRAELIRPWQFREEILALAEEIEAKRPAVVLEIGTANGGTLFIASRLATEDALLISVDLPGGKFGGGYPDWKVPIYESFARPGQRIELIRRDSHLDSTFEEVERVLAGRAVDYLFIDGDHTYAGARQDFQRYSPLVRAGGLIGFHDIVVHPQDSECDVYRFWNEVKESYPHREYVNDWEQKCFGVGVIDLVAKPEQA